MGSSTRQSCRPRLPNDPRRKSEHHSRLHALERMFRGDRHSASTQLDGRVYIGCRKWVEEYGFREWLAERDTCGCVVEQESGLPESAAYGWGIQGEGRACCAGSSGWSSW
jgi:hypothetical protein